MTSNSLQTPTLDARVWAIDPGHAEIGFVGRHVGLTKIRGRFTAVDGAVVVGDNISSSTINVVIDKASVSSGDVSRYDHLRSGGLFDVAAYPNGVFRSTAITAPPDGTHGSISGELTLKGITRPVALDVEYLGRLTDPWGGERAVFSASATINREDWGLTWNMLLDTGGLLVSKTVALEIELELVKQP